MTHDTPPKQIWIAPVHDQWRSGTGEWMDEFWGLPTETPYILASEADAMVAAALREAHDAIADYPRSSPEEAEWSRYDEQIDHSQRIIETLIPLPASAALDKLIAEAVQAERAIWTQAIETYFDATAVEDVELHVAALRAPSPQERTMTDATGLLPCPFCGCTTITTTAQDDHTKWHGCDWCECVGPIEEPDAEPPQGWNVRATPEILASSPDVAALIRKAEARVRDHAAQIGGDAAVEVLLRHEPDAGPLKIQMIRQAIANPIRRAAKGEPT